MALNKIPRFHYTERHQYFETRIKDIKFEPYANVNQAKNGTVELSGYMKVLLNNLIKNMNFSYTLMVSPDRTFGKKLDNGSWTGMLGMLQRSEADMILVPLSQSQERLEAATMSVAIAISSTNMLVGVPHSPPINFAFLAAADYKVLIGLAMCFLLVTLVGKLITIVLYQADVGVRFWTIVEIFFQKGSSALPETNSGRLLLIGWVLSTFVLITAISTALTSLLSVAGKPDYVKSLQDLLRFPNTKVILPKGSSTTKFVENSTDPVLKYVWRSVQKKESFILHPDNFSSDSVLELVKMQSFVIMKNADELKSILRDLSRKKTDCTYYDISEPIRFTSLTLAFRKDFNDTLIHKINEIISWTVDTSYLRFLDPGVDIEYRRCLANSKNDDKEREEPLGFSIFKAPLIMLGCGCALAASLLLIELFKLARASVSPAVSETEQQLEKYRQEKNGTSSPCTTGPVENALDVNQQSDMPTTSIKFIENNLRLLSEPK